jgi:HlyD family secretion protein
MRRAVLIVLLVAAGVGGVIWWLTHRQPPSPELALYGNIDLRQVQLAFNNNERLAEVLVQEGDCVRQGQLLAKLDTSRLVPQVKQAEAMVAAQRHAVERLHNGSRPEEIAQARANVESARADAARSRLQFKRAEALHAMQSSSQEEYDNARAAFEVAEAKVAVADKALQLALIGPRKEDIDQAEAQLRGNEAQLALLKRQLADAELFSPSSATVRTRLLEPGEMVSPQRPVLSLAITDPKWVRAYVSEPDLGKVHPGMTASVAVDSFPGRRFEGWVGFVSPVAEFTPKTVQTDELRTSLVYEVRVFIKDPSDDLRLGMPATVYLPLEPPTEGKP